VVAGRAWAADDGAVRVLVVEDEASVATGVRRGLAAEGYRVDVAADGAQGLNMALSEEYDLVVLDLMLPKRNGYQVCRQLRAELRWMPILILTAKTGEWDEAEGLDTGADDYLTKPFSMPVLLARVRALLRRPPVPWLEPFTNGDLRIDPQRGRCWRGDEEVELTGRELEVLTYLLRRVDHVVTRAELLDAIWGVDFDGDPNIVDVYIGRLRRKVDVPFGARDLQTVRGIGYRVRGPAGAAARDGGGP
jgi:DNA-binding response OmpR family regulator